MGAAAGRTVVEQLAVTPADVHDSNRGDSALPPNPGEVQADNAYIGVAVLRQYGPSH